MRVRPGSLLLLIVASWCVGLFARVYWTPDEPREAALAATMHVQLDRSVPLLNGKPFAEKPPLTYWLAAASIDSFGSSPAAARLPQLLYALLSLAAVFALGRAAAGRATGTTAALVFATSLLVYQTQIWLACDALLIAGSCIALFGAFRGLWANNTGQRLLGYLIMHAGLTLAFFAKNFAAWLVPVSCWLAFVVWERRWRELWRWELWLGAVLPAVCIAAWVYWVAQRVDSAAVLRVFFWNNLLGRVVSVAAAPELQYTSGHRNWPGKYLVELLLYLVPWTTLAWFAARRSWKNVREPSATRTAWRFAVCASVPSLVILSLAATARNVYAAPSLAGIALLIALWLNDSPESMRRAHVRGLTLSAWLIMIMAALCLVTTLLLGWAAATATDPVIVFFSMAACVICIVWCWRERQHIAAASAHESLNSLLGAYSLLLSAGVLSAVLAINRWQDLRPVAEQMREAIGTHAYALLNTDETTQAWASLYLPAAPIDTVAASQANRSALMAFFDKYPDARVLALLPRAKWNRRDWLAYLSGNPQPQQARAAAQSDEWSQQWGLQVESFAERPGGRSYVLLSR